MCAFVRLRLWEGGCQLGLFWGHSDARVRHIQTLPALPYHNSSHHKSQRRKSAPQTTHTTLQALPHHHSRSDFKPKAKKHNLRDARLLIAAAMNKVHCGRSLFCVGNDLMLQLSCFSNYYERVICFNCYWQVRVS